MRKIKSITLLLVIILTGMALNSCSKEDNAQYLVSYIAGGSISSSGSGALSSLYVITGYQKVINTVLNNNNSSTVISGSSAPKDSEVKTKCDEYTSTLKSSTTSTFKGTITINKTVQKAGETGDGTTTTLATYTFN